MRVREILPIAFGLVFFAGSSLAQDEEEGLSGRVAFGFLATSGNSDNENLSLSFGGDYYAEIWHHNLEGRAVRASTSGVTTADASSLSWQSDRDFGEQSYLYARAAWDTNEFGGIRKQVRQTVGYGRHFLNSERHTLDAEVGGGLRQSELIDGTDDDGSILRLSMDYDFQFSETAKFEQTIGIERGSENTFSESITSLTADIWNDLAIVLSYTIKRNSDVPAGTVKKDTFTAISLEYSF